MTSSCLNESELRQSVLGALNLSLPTDPCRLRQILAKAADASKTLHTLGKAADAATVCAPLGLEGPPGLLLPDGFTPPPGLAPPSGLATPSCFKAGKYRDEAVSVSDDYIESDAEGTSIGTGCYTSSGLSDREDTKPEAEKFQMKANAPRFVPSIMSDILPLEISCRQQKTFFDPAEQQETPLRTSLRKGASVFVPMLSAHETTGMAEPARPITSVKTRGFTNRFTKGTQARSFKVEC